MYIARDAPADQSIIAVCRSERSQNDVEEFYTVPCHTDPDRKIRWNVLINVYPIVITTVIYI